MKKNIRIRLALVLLSLLTVVWTTGCGPDPGATAPAAGGAQEAGEGKATTGAKAQPPQQLAIALGHGLDYIGVDPFGPGRENTLLATVIYEPLALEGPDGQMEPALAESWNTSPDGLQWTFHLRKGVKFHDGTDFDARAVEGAFKRYLQNPATAMRLGIKEMRTPDSHTVTFTLQKPSAAFLSVVGSFSTVIPAPSAHDPSGKLIQPIGTGPFKVKSHDRQQVELAAFDGHWRGRPRLDEVTVRYLPDPSTMVLSLEAGEVDLIGADGYGIPRSEIKRLQADPKLKISVDLRDTSIEWVGFNLNRAPLNDIKVRQAINYAVDRNALVNHLLEGFGVPAVGPLDHDPKTPWVNPSIAGYAFDPQKARALLTDAGWRDTDGNGVLDKDGRELKLSLMFEGTRDWKLYAEAMQQDLAKVGIKLDLQMRETEVMRDLQKQGNFDMVALGGIGKSRVEPYYYFTYYYSSRGGAAVMRDKQLDAMIFRLTSTLDRTEREKLYHKVQESIWAQVPGVYLVHPARVSATQVGVADWRSAGTMDPLRWLYLVHRE